MYSCASAFIGKGIGSLCTWRRGELRSQVPWSLRKLGQVLTGVLLSLGFKENIPQFPFTLLLEKGRTSSKFRRWYRGEGHSPPILLHSRKYFWGINGYSSPVITDFFVSKKGKSDWCAYQHIQVLNLNLKKGVEIGEQCLSIETQTLKN